MLRRLIPFVCVIFCGAIAVAQEKLNVVDQQPIAPEAISGQWITNQGVLDLSMEGEVLTGTLNEKIKVSGLCSTGKISIEYKTSAKPTKVTLALDKTGRWISGESKTGNATTEWFGCRTVADAADPVTPADLSGHWLMSWGIMQLTQNGNEADGKYGADDYGNIEGKIVGPRMNFQWRRHQATGKAWMEQSPDGKQLIGRTIETDKPSTVVGTRTSEFQHHQSPVAGKTIRGISDSGMLYHLRMPDNWDASKEADVIVLLHGSNFTTAGMVSVVANQWPDIAKRFAILGIQGERWAEWSTPKDLRFNYTYVNWMGRSTYKGFPFTDRESPFLVVDVIDELDKLHSFGRVFVGGHSQGGFLTYILHMHFPEKLAGTFPVAGGMPIQSDPQAFDDNALMTEQRKKPMVIIHGTRDNVVSPSMSAYAHQSFLARDFHLVKRLSPEAGHPFDFLPINDAIDWLDIVTSSDPTALTKFAAKQTDKKSWRDVGAIVQRAKVLGVEEQLRDSIAAFEAAAAENVESHLNAIQSNADGNWIHAFLEWHDQFALSEAAQPAIRAFQDLRTVHRVEASRLESEAKKAFRENKTDEGWAKYREIIDKYYASPQYRTLSDNVKKHFVGR